MDESQLSALKIARSGHNCLITGMPGTGKTYLLGQILDCMLVDHRNVLLTASTGKAALVLRNKLNVPMNCSTLHSCFGLMDGRFTNQELLKLYQGEEYDRHRSCIKSLDVLVIDEVSMISSRTLDQVEVVLRHVKNSLQAFGGVQIILTGDFFQLPPVPSPAYGDEGKYLFTHPVVQSCFHHVDLKNIHRQEEPDLMNAIQETSQGHLSQDSLYLMLRMGRSLPPSAPGLDETLTLSLYATNFEVDLHNAQSLQEMEGVILLVFIVSCLYFQGIFPRT